MKLDIVRLCVLYLTVITTGVTCQSQAQGKDQVFHVITSLLITCCKTTVMAIKLMVYPLEKDVTYWIGLDGLGRNNENESWVCFHPDLPTVICQHIICVVS